MLTRCCPLVAGDEEAGLPEVKLGWLGQQGTWTGSGHLLFSSCPESLQHMDPFAASATSAGYFTGCATQGKVTESGDVRENFSCKILLIIFLWISPPPDKMCVTNSQMVSFILCWRRPSLPGACPFSDFLTIFGFFSPPN